MLGTPWIRTLVLALLLSGAALDPTPAGAQTPTPYHAHLSLLPVDAGGARRTTGVGQVEATLTDRILLVEGTFEGLASPVSQAELHEGAPGFRGPAVLPLQVTGDRAGRVFGRVELTGAQLQALRSGNLYIQIYTETNPEGAIRGWLFSREGED